MNGLHLSKKWKDKKTGEWVEGETYWIKYYRNGKPYCESTHSNEEAKAKRLLGLREREISKGNSQGFTLTRLGLMNWPKIYSQTTR